MTDRKRPEMRRSTAAELSAIKTLPTLTSLIGMLKVLASLDNEMQLQTVAMLMVVAQRPGVYQSEMHTLVGVSQSSVSRNVHALSDTATMDHRASALWSNGLMSGMSVASGCS